MNDIEIKGGNTFTINQILNNKIIDIIDNKTCKIGQINLNYSEEIYNSLLDYIKSEMQINTIFSFDYPLNNNSDKKNMNYEIIEEIIITFSKILILYDYDQKFSINRIENDNSINSEIVQNLNGILNYFRNQINTKEIINEKKEKTKIGELLNLILEKKIKKETDEGINKYYIHIIILNNLNSDIEETKKIFEVCSDLPISYILILNSQNKNEIKNFYLSYEFINTKRKIIQILNINNIEKIHSIIREVGNEIENYYEYQKSSDFFLLSEN